MPVYKEEILDKEESIEESIENDASFIKEFFTSYVPVFHFYKWLEGENLSELALLAAFEAGWWAKARELT